MRNNFFLLSIWLAFLVAKNKSSELEAVVSGRRTEVPEYDFSSFFNLGDHSTQVAEHAAGTSHYAATAGQPSNLPPVVWKQREYGELTRLKPDVLTTTKILGDHSTQVAEHAAGTSHNGAIAGQPSGPPPVVWKTPEYGELKRLEPTVMITTKIHAKGGVTANNQEKHISLRLEKEGDWKNFERSRSIKMLNLSKTHSVIYCIYDPHARQLSHKRTIGPDLGERISINIDKRGTTIELRAWEGCQQALPDGGADGAKEKEKKRKKPAATQLWLLNRQF
ncbi:hypothetical protein PtA15_1A101 [Puccinia triticina]|uniref:Uncharacterized protein n=1 Tax=Puccinia triticina TaxID=208348 RepID=A0ABY7C7A1_9BASI|nr:uncharacterized protein PtA15_1A101 [Puccinia triticina]WAQ80763.1 hypothetical protein PtA15_1A101 [Puccinia triticina]WAR51654.1 hypothetical protein PtB15_1B90 [Puccinia triticina]